MSPTLEYGFFTLKDRKIMAAIEGNRCPICNADLAPVPGTLQSCTIDHDHVTGLIRGAICACCNVALSFVERGKREATQAQSDYLARGPLDHPALDLSRNVRVSLTRHEQAMILEIGDGSLSAGIRKLMEEHYEKEATR